MPDNAVLVSFDDGFKNNLTLAAPLLAKYKVPAAVFVTTDYIGTSGQLFWALELSQRLMNSDEDSVTLSGITYPLPDTSHSERSSSVIIITNATKKIPANERQIFLEDVRSKTDYDISAPWQKELYEFLTWDEVRTLRKQGIEIGCHTASHPILSALNPDELDRELRESKKKIEQELGEECDTIAYPFGSENDFSNAVMTKAQKHGFRLGFTLTNRRNAEVPKPFEIHRKCITRDLTLNSFKAIISGIRGN